VRYIRGRAAALAHVRSEIEELQGLRRGKVQVVASQALAPRFLPEVIRDFRQTHPLVAFDVRIGDHVQAAAALRGFETDLALVFNLAPEADIERASVVEQRLMAIMHAEHPLARGGAPALRLRDCVDYPVILPNRDTGGRQLIERFLARSSIRMYAMVESNSFEFLRGCLDDRRSLSFQMAIGVTAADHDIVAREIEDRGFPRGELVLASLRGRQLPVIAYAFAEFVRERLAALG
jgi:DNA-binding transcriptional LysR family regulator